MSAGKGDAPRPVNMTAYITHYDAIFRKDKPEPKPEHGK